MSTPLEKKYRKLRIKESLPIHYRYPIACKELSLILGFLYKDIPKNLQSLVFEDTLSAIRLLPQIQSQEAFSAVRLLASRANDALPRQKRNLVGAEFKHAMVAYKRRCKAIQPENGAIHLPLDVVIQIFNYLDVRSLVSASQVCWTWNFAASDNDVWKSQFDAYFNRSDYRLAIKRKLKEADISSSDHCLTIKGKLWASLLHLSQLINSSEDGTSIDWKDAFRNQYIGTSHDKLTSNRGYCENCDAVVWLDKMKCTNVHSEPQADIWKIDPIPLSSNEVIQCVTGYSLSRLSSSVSGDTESDDTDNNQLIFRLWAYSLREC